MTTEEMFPIISALDDKEAIDQVASTWAEVAIQMRDTR